VPLAPCFNQTRSASGGMDGFGCFVPPSAGGAGAWMG